MEKPGETKCTVAPVNPSRADDLAPGDITHLKERGICPDEVNASPSGTSPSAVVHDVRAETEQVVLWQNPRPVMIPEETAVRARGGREP